MLRFILLLLIVSAIIRGLFGFRRPGFLLSLFLAPWLFGFFVPISLGIGLIIILAAVGGILSAVLLFPVLLLAAVLTSFVFAIL